VCTSASICYKARGLAAAPGAGPGRRRESNTRRGCGSRMMIGDGLRGISLGSSGDPIIHMRISPRRPQRVGVARRHRHLSPPSGTTSAPRPRQPSEPERRSLTLCYSSYFWWCWRALSAAIAFLGIVSLCRPPPHQDRGRARAAGNRFARDDKVPGPQLRAKQLPGKRPRESAET
jgi:hypothetical protein